MTVYTGGTFDVLHAGHVDFLAVCRKVVGQEGKVIVGLNSDAFIQRYKKKPPVCLYEERKQVLQSCRFVDEVIENLGCEDSKPAILSANPDFIVVGEDWANRDYYAQMQFSREWLAIRGITLLYVPRYRSLSSTEIKERAYAQRVGTSSLPA